MVNYTQETILYDIEELNEKLKLGINDEDVLEFVGKEILKNDVNNAFYYLVIEEAMARLIYDYPFLNELNFEYQINRSATYFNYFGEKRSYDVLNDEFFKILDKSNIDFSYLKNYDLESLKRENNLGIKYPLNDNTFDHNFDVLTNYFSENTLIENYQDNIDEMLNTD